MSNTSASDPFIGPRLKVERAKQHVQQLSTDLGSFVKANPIGLIREDNAKTGQSRWRVTGVKPLPLMWSCYIGDTVHNLRSALDLLVCDLVRANGQQVRRKTSFPFSDTRKKFETDGLARIKGVSPTAIRLFQRLKPYKGRNGGKALFLIHELDVLDKHKMIIPVGAGYARIAIKLDAPTLPGRPAPEGLRISFAPKDRQFPLQDGAIVFAAPIGEIDYDPQVTIQVAFGEGQIAEGEPMIPTLNQLVDFTERLINIFAKYT